MTQYITLRMTLKQGEAAWDALAAAYIRASTHMDLDKPHGTVKEQQAMFHLRAALRSGIREGHENQAKRGNR